MTWALDFIQPKKTHLILSNIRKCPFSLPDQPIGTCASKSNIFDFMLRWPAFLTVSIQTYRLRMCESISHVIEMLTI